MIKTICDLCGKEIPTCEPIYRVRSERHTPEKSNRPDSATAALWNAIVAKNDPLELDVQDVCGPCAQDISEHVKRRKSVADKPKYDAVCNALDGLPAVEVGHTACDDDLSGVN